MPFGRPLNMANFKFRIEQDVQHRLLILKLVDPATNLVVDGAPTIRLQLDALRYATPSGTDELIEATFRRIYYLDANDGSKQRCYGLLTAPESDATDDGHSDDVEDLYLGGGGNGTHFCVYLVHGDYLDCVTWDGTAYGDTHFVIAKPPLLRHSLKLSVGVAFSNYSIAEDNACTRKASYGLYPDQTEGVFPIWITASEGPIGTAWASEIWADQPVGGVGRVYDDDGTTLLSPVPTWMDTNRDARCWQQLQ